MKVTVSRDEMGIVVWKSDVELELYSPFKYKNSKVGVAMWTTTNYWFDFRAKIFNYNQVDELFPKLKDKIQVGKVKYMELDIV